MPTILVDLEDLRRLIGGDYDLAGLGADLELVKGELKGRDDDSGRTRIELNDTNRPDLWSAAGIARQIRAARRGGLDSYPAFEKEPGSAEIRVEKRAREVRPFAGGFLARGPAITAPSLAELIQSQEKLCDGYGAKRRTVSVGIYRSEKIRFPVHYRMAEPERTAFVPLGMDESLDLRRILERHPKGVEYGHILRGCERFPLLVDDTGEVLSFPPIINSRAIGEVLAGDRELFVEATGTDLRSVLLVLNILAADLTDRGYDIEPVTTVFPNRTPYGRRVRVPYPLANRVTVASSDFHRLLGTRFEPGQIEHLLRAYGCDVVDGRKTMRVSTAPFRQDYMHPVDAVEDLAIAYGLNRLQPISPERFTPGHLQPVTLLEDKVREMLIGLGYEEIISNVLNARADLSTRLRVDEAPVVGIANVMTESYSTLRWTLLANALAVEERSAKTPYPHHIFEVGEVVVRDPEDNHGARTESVLGAFSAHPQASFSEMHAVLQYVLFYLGHEAELRPLDRGSFLPGRGAAILINGATMGLLGEIHPEVLEQWGVRMPAAYVELRLLPSALLR